MYEKVSVLKQAIIDRMSQIEALFPNLEEELKEKRLEDYDWTGAISRDIAYLESVKHTLKIGKRLSKLSDNALFNKLMSLAKPYEELNQWLNDDENEEKTKEYAEKLKKASNLFNEIDQFSRCLPFSLFQELLEKVSESLQQDHNVGYSLIEVFCYDASWYEEHKDDLRTLLQECQLWERSYVKFYDGNEFHDNFRIVSDYVSKKAIWDMNKDIPFTGIRFDPEFKKFK